MVSDDLAVRDFETLTILACAVQGGCCGMKNEVTKSVGFGFHYSWRKHNRDE